MLTILAPLVSCLFQDQAPTHDLPEPDSVPIEMSGAFPVVEIKVGSTRTVKMVLDTGSGYTWFKPGLPWAKPGEVEISFGKSTAKTAFRARKLSVVDLVNLRRQEKDVVGALGVDVLGRFKVGLDLNARVLALWSPTERLSVLARFFSTKTYVPNPQSSVRWIDPGATVASPGSPTGQGWEVKGRPPSAAPYFLPLFERLGLPGIEVEIGTRRSFAILDTGAEESFLRKAQVSTKGEPFIVVTPDGTLTAERGIVPTISLGGHLVARQEGALVSETPPSGLEILGIPFLEKGRWLFDFQGAAVLFFPEG